MNNRNNGGLNGEDNERRTSGDRRKQNVPVDDDRRSVKDDRRNN